GGRIILMNVITPKALSTKPIRWARHWLRAHPRRLLTAPKVESGVEPNMVVVRGLVCSVCAARTQGALSRVPGVEEASVDLDAGPGTLRLGRGMSLDAPAAQRALERVVVGMNARRAIERVTRAMARRSRR